MMELCYQLWIDYVEIFIVTKPYDVLVTQGHNAWFSFLIEFKFTDQVIVWYRPPWQSQLIIHILLGSSLWKSAWWSRSHTHTHTKIINCSLDYCRSILKISSKICHNSLIHSWISDWRFSNCDPDCFQTLKWNAAGFSPMHLFFTTWYVLYQEADDCDNAAFSYPSRVISDSDACRLCIVPIVVLLTCK